LGNVPSLPKSIEYFFPVALSQLKKDVKKGRKRACCLFSVIKKLFYLEY